MPIKATITRSDLSDAVSAGISFKVAYLCLIVLKLKQVTRLELKRICQMNRIV